MFEIKATDLAGRIGKLTTKSGVMETPALLPVIHPSRQTLSPKIIKNLGFQAVITNAYIALKNCEEIRKKGIHKTIDFDGIIMTDSGGYQVLEYGDVNVSPETMTIFQEEIGSDIAVVLDKPTGSQVNRKYAEKTVNETLKAAKKTLEIKSKKDVTWVGPIQGGIHLDLVAYSANEISKMGFNIAALGSPTEIMKSYQFDMLSAMIIAAKTNIPINMPLHLFGAGHPLTIPLAIALGCDLFDSASYMLYAREQRYLTDYGTLRLKNMKYLNCSCPFCSSNSLNDLLNQERDEQINTIALHNLHVLMKSVNESKEAIHEGRLWEYLGSKARFHPRLWEAFRSLGNKIEYLEEGSSLFKSKAVFFSDALDFKRPEVFHHRTRLANNIEINKPSLLLLPEAEIRPFYRSPLYIKINNVMKERMKNIQVCYILPTFGVIPIEISDIYPLSQYESSFKPDSCNDLSQSVVDDVMRIINSDKVLKIVMLINGVFSRKLSEILTKTKKIIIIEDQDKNLKNTVKKVVEAFSND